LKPKPQRGKPSFDVDGVRVEERGRAWVLRAVLVSVVAVVSWGALIVTRPFDRGGPIAEPDPTVASTAPRIPVAKPALASPQSDEPTRADTGRAVIRPRRGGRASDGSSERESGKSVGDGKPAGIDARDYIAALRARGETEGVAAFSPPGTRPPRPGVIVPEGYVLPEGFARHYQTTDDGRRLAPILAVAPEYEIVDDHGDPVELVDDRIVPPEYAPQDLPVRMLEVPSEDARGVR